MTHDLFTDLSTMPLATRMRPQTLADFVGQSHLLAEGKPIWGAAHGHLHSMLLWGPPGSGKTTLAQLLARQSGAHWITLSAVMSGVKDIRAAIDTAKASKKPTVLFIDEVHRFNKTQQDALLPFVEEGVVTLIGATTENPSFEINNALLSRVRVYVLKRLTEEDLVAILQRALSDKEHGLGSISIDCRVEILQQIAQAADGDARNALNILDVMLSLAQAEQQTDSYVFDEALLKQVLSTSLRRFDKSGEIFYDLISALHKSVRGSNPDAALYWFARMLDGGCDPLYIARRVVRMATEDIGNADPRALTLALNAWDVQERLGSPEGELAIAQAVVYMACAAKSNAVYKAFNAVMADVGQHGTYEVPIHLRNAPTKLMRELGYGKAYRYAHDEPHAYAAGEHYFPEGLPERQYYVPTDRGLEKQIQEKLTWLKQLDMEYKNK
ncbi:MAG: replication-associated recombination protein A [Gammaproteobacteria bacterium]